MILESILKKQNIEHLRDKFKKDKFMLVYENFQFNTLTSTLTKTFKDGRIVYLEGLVHSYKKVDRIFEVDHGICKVGQRSCFTWLGVKLK